MSGVLYFRIGNSKQSLELRLADTAARTFKLEADLTAANEQQGALREQQGALKEQQGALKAQVKGLNADLEATQAKLAKASDRAEQLDRDLTATKEVLNVYEMTARALADEVAALRVDLDDSRSSHAAPEAVLGYKNTIAELERQLDAARTAAAMPPAAIAPTAVFMSRAGRATVLTVGPEGAFVVLNFGSARGAQLGQKLTVSQGTSEVATVLISDVRANFSVAQVLPESVRGVLQKGDSALLIR